MLRFRLGRDNHDLRLNFFHGSRRGGRGAFFLNHHYLAAFPVIPPGTALSFLRVMIVPHVFNEFNFLWFLGTI
jgi:hypothetical protein